MPKPKSGEVWLVRFPFTDLTTTKVRPALVVAAHGDDIIVKSNEALKRALLLK